MVVSPALVLVIANLKFKWKFKEIFFLVIPTGFSVENLPNNESGFRVCAGSNRE